MRVSPLTSTTIMEMMVRSVDPSTSGMASSSEIMIPTSSVQSWARSPMKLRLFKASVQNGFMSRPAHMKKRVMKDPTASCPGDPALMNTNNVVIRNLLRRAMSERDDVSGRRTLPFAGNVSVFWAGHSLSRHLHSLPPPVIDSVCTQESMLVLADTKRQVCTQ